MARIGDAFFAAGPFLWRVFDARRRCGTLRIVNLLARLPVLLFSFILHCFCLPQPESRIHHWKRDLNERHQV
jgi:hypothetical protein